MDTTLQLDAIALHHTLQKLNPDITGAVPFVCNKITRPFMILHVLEQNKSDCMVVTKNQRLVYLQANGTHLLPTQLKTQAALIKKAYPHCQKKKRLLIVPLFIKLASMSSGHENMLIFNTVRNEVERFEPHGDDTGVEGVNNVEINASIKSFVDSLELPGKPKYVPQNEVCPTARGWQSFEQEVKREDFAEGLTEPHYCCAWSFFWANMRLKYKKFSAKQLITEINKALTNDPEKLFVFIRNQARFLHTELNKAGDFINYIKLLKVRDTNPKYIEAEQLYTDYYLEKLKSFSHLMKQHEKKSKITKKNTTDLTLEPNPKGEIIDLTTDTEKHPRAKRGKDPVSDEEEEKHDQPLPKKKKLKRLTGYDVMKIIQKKSLSDKQTVEQLRSHSFSPSARDANGHVQLVIAAMENKKKTVKYLLEQGAKLETKQTNGYSPLSAVLAQENYKMAKFLIQLGADFVEAAKKVPEEAEDFKKSAEGKSLIKGG
jgi:hypothetical protein